MLRILSSVFMYLGWFGILGSILTIPLTHWHPVLAVILAAICFGTFYCLLFPICLLKAEKQPIIWENIDAVLVEAAGGNL